LYPRPTPPMRIHGGRPWRERRRRSSAQRPAPSA